MGDGDGDGDGGGLRDEMDKTAELAEQFGISGDDGDPEDEEVLETSAEVESSEPPETLETQEASTTSEPPGGDDDGSSEPQEQDNVQEVGGVMEREYPNPDKEVGQLQISMTISMYSSLLK